MVWRKLAMPDRSRWPAQGCGLAPWCICRTRQNIPKSSATIRFFRRVFYWRRVLNCATWRRSVAISCSGRAARIFGTPATSPATSAVPAAVARRLTASIRRHAILGVSGHCIAAYPGDFAQALIALDASIEVRERNGLRSFPLANLHKLPGATPHVETSLAPGELITAILVPDADFAKRSLFTRSATGNRMNSRSPLRRSRSIFRTKLYGKRE
jgi:FAD binding domain in molybdopterin dehydrogenase